MCLRILATQWGLHNSNLQRIIIYLKRKRGPDTNLTEIDPKRLRSEDNIEEEECESIITVDQDGNTFLQEREVRLGPRVLVPPEILRQGLEEHVIQRARLSSSSGERIVWRARSTPREEILARMLGNSSRRSVREGDKETKSNPSN
jgi:hypothetical protein